MSERGKRDIQARGGFVLSIRERDETILFSCTSEIRIF